MKTLPLSSPTPRQIQRAAGMLLRHLDQRPPFLSAALRDAMAKLAAHQDLLMRQWRLLLGAQQRGWSLAAKALHSELSRQAAVLGEHVTSLTLATTSTRPPEPGSCSGPLLRTLVEELSQLDQEFPSVCVDLKNKIVSVQTDAIELEEQYLGPFKIELHIDRLSSNTDSWVFDCIALDPHPAASSDDVTHPHVKDGAICAGEAAVPISLALAQGRLCDAFCLMRSVLSQYNPHSPYVPLEDWEGVRCSDCGCVTSRDDLCYCDGCGNDVCSDCMSCCDICDTSCCSSCLEHDRVSDQRCCSVCRDYCGHCGRLVDADSFNGDSGLCPQCQPQRELPLPQEIPHETALLPLVLGP